MRSDDLGHSWLSADVSEWVIGDTLGLKTVGSCHQQRGCVGVSRRDSTWASRATPTKMRSHFPNRVADDGRDICKIDDVDCAFRSCIEFVSLRYTRGTEVS